MNKHGEVNTWQGMNIHPTMLQRVPSDDQVLKVKAREDQPTTIEVVRISMLFRIYGFNVKNGTQTGMTTADSGERFQFEY